MSELYLAGRWPEDGGEWEVMGLYASIADATVAHRDDERAFIVGPLRVGETLPRETVLFETQIWPHPETARAAAAEAEEKS